MQEDFLQSLAYIGFTARIKRLSDGLMYDARRIYAHSQLEIEPNWHLVLLLLKKEKELTVTQIAKQIGFSHPAIIKITQKMKEKGYLHSKPDLLDSRKSLLFLSQKSLDQFPVFESKWKRVETILEALVDDSFLSQLTDLENQLKENGVSGRFITQSEDEA